MIRALVFFFFLRLHCLWTPLPVSHDFLELTVFFVVWCSLWWFWNLWSSGLWHRVIFQVNVNVSEVHSASILRFASTMKIFFRPEEVISKNLDPSARRYCVATQKAAISLFFRFAGVALGKACLLRKVFFVVLFARVIHDTSLLAMNWINGAILLYKSVNKHNNILK